MEKDDQGGIGPERHRYEGQEAWRLPAVPPWVSLTCEHSVSPSPSPRRGRRLGGTELQRLLKKVVLALGGVGRFGRAERGWGCFLSNHSVAAPPRTA